jgi:hypothetical protein
MLSLKIQMALATSAAILSGLLLLGIGYLITPYTVGSEAEIPLPVPSATRQVLTGILWVGIAAFVAFCIVVLGVIINRKRQKKMPETFEEPIV